MNRILDSELLSAYLDGELSAVEKAEVERRLAEDPASRQLLEELRAVSSAVRELPPQALGEDLSGSVLREARQRSAAEAPAEGDPVPAGDAPVWRSAGRRALRPRTLLWSAVAVAAAVMIVFWHPDPPAQVARQPQQGPAVANRQGPGEIPKIGPAPGDRPPAGPDLLVVVRCDMAPKAAQQKTFQRILAARDLPPAEVTQDPASAIARAADGAAAGRINVSGTARPIYLRVEMSAEQLEAALADLKAQPELFPACKVEERTPPPEPGKAPGKRQVVFVLRVVP